ncbi:MAG: CbiX/SirB N-terminal domain-containing protein [Microthrixaceae bacterium]
MNATPEELPSGPAVAVLVAHGSRNPDSADAHEDLVREVGAASGLPTRVAYLEMCEPSIPRAIDAAVGDGASTVLVVPCFLHPGNHVQVDIPAVVEAARVRHPGTAIVLTEHLGASEGMVALLAAIVGEAAPPAPRLSR